jgi:hypothetical protein
MISSKNTYDSIFVTLDFTNGSTRTETATGGICHIETLSNACVHLFTLRNALLRVYDSRVHDPEDFDIDLKDDGEGTPVAASENIAVEIPPGFNAIAVQTIDEAATSVWSKVVARGSY